MVKAEVKAYLAHTFEHRKYVKEILTPKIHAIGISTRNPFYEIDGTTKRKEVMLADKADIQGMADKDQHNILRSVPADKEKDLQKWIRMVRRNSKKIVTRDLGFIDRTDFTIAFLTKLSKGTSDEIFFTGVIKRRPVFLLCDNQELCDHPWMIYECRFGKICKTENELLKALKRKYG